jgi:L-rhamnose mutarotase
VGVAEWEKKDKNEIWNEFEMILRKNSIENLNIFYKESHSIIVQAHFPVWI